MQMSNQGPTLLLSSINNQSSGAAEGAKVIKAAVSMIRL